MSLEYIESTDTVNMWMQKLNALVDYINNTSGAKLIIKSNTRPVSDLFFGKLWYDTGNNVLNVFDDSVGEFISWNTFFVPEMKFLQKTIANNYIIPSTKHAISVSPLINSGVTVTVSNTSIFAIV